MRDRCSSRHLIETSTARVRHVHEGHPLFELSSGLDNGCLAGTAVGREHYTQITVTPAGQRTPKAGSH